MRLGINFDHFELREFAFCSQQLCAEPCSTKRYPLSIPSKNNLVVGAGGGLPLSAVDRPQLLAEARWLLVTLPAHRVECWDLKTQMFFFSLLVFNYSVLSS